MHKLLWTIMNYTDQWIERLFVENLLILYCLKQLYKTQFLIHFQNRMFHKLCFWCEILSIWKVNNFNHGQTRLVMTRRDHLTDYFESSKNCEFKQKITKTFDKKLTIIVQYFRIRSFRSRSSTTRWTINYDQMRPSLHTSIIILYA